MLWVSLKRLSRLFIIPSNSVLYVPLPYSFLIYDDDELVRNFIPCYSTTTVTDVEGIVRAKDTIGLYDIVNNKFYTNKESGTFEKGNDV